MADDEELWAPPEALAWQGDLTEDEFQARVVEEGHVWVVVAGAIYDVLEWNEYHPGGDFLVAHAGEDMTTEFELVKHSEAARAHMKKHFHVGNIVFPGASTGAGSNITSKL